MLNISLNRHHDDDSVRLVRVNQVTRVNLLEQSSTSLDFPFPKEPLDEWEVETATK